MLHVQFVTSDVLCRLLYAEINVSYSVQYCCDVIVWLSSAHCTVCCSGAVVTIAHSLPSWISVCVLVTLHHTGLLVSPVC